MNEQQSHPSEQSSFDLRQLVLRWLISTLAIFATVWTIPGITFEGPGWQLGIVALVFGLLSALLRTRIMILSMVTLGLPGLVIFVLLINALLLFVSSLLSEPLGIQFVVDGFWSAFLGGLVISFVTLVLSILAGDRRIVIQVQRGNNHDHLDDE